MAVDTVAVSPPGTLSTLAWALTAILLPPYLVYFGWFKYFDLAYRICLAECNRRWNRKRYAAEAKRGAPKTMVSLVGYREEAAVYEKSLASLKRGRTGTVVVAIDGNEAEDIKMVRSFQKVFGESASNVLNLEESLGKRFARQLDAKKLATKGDAVTDPSIDASEAQAFKSAYDYAKNALSEAGLLEPGAPPQALCFTQPHCDLKEIRFSAWIVSFVVADAYGFEYLWSSDSDTRVAPDTIDTLARVIRAEPRAAGGGVYVKLHNAGSSAFARMAGLAWGLDTYMNRGALGAFGRSECLNGPSSMFRIAALREVAVAQYRFHYFKQKPETYQNTVLNEDIQTTMLLAKRGWERLYIENAYILTGGPETLRQWLGQRLRWSRGINLHRVFDAWYIASQGPLTVWYWLRSGFYDALIFLWVSYYTFTGRQLFPVTVSDVVVFEVLPPLYNFLRCTAPLPDPLTTVCLFAFYRLVCPSYRMYTFLTPFGVGWSLPKSQKGERSDLLKFVRREHETLFFVFWMATAAGAAGRFLASYDFVPYTPEIMVASFMVVASIFTATAMFMD